MSNLSYNFEFVEFVFKLTFFTLYFIFEIIALIIVKISKKRIKSGRLLRLTIIYPLVIWILSVYYTYLGIEYAGADFEIYIKTSVGAIVSYALDYIFFIFGMFIALAKIYEYMGLIRAKSKKSEMLKEYKNMLKDKLISEEDYNAIKDEILGLEPEQEDMEILKIDK